MNGTSGLTTILAKRVSPSASQMPGSEIIFADDLDVASDGTVYFSTMVDVPPVPGPTGEYDAMKPCALNIMQVGCCEQPASCIHGSKGHALLHDAQSRVWCSFQ